MTINTGMKVSRELLEESGIPAHMHGGIIRYIENALPPGGFLTAVIENDLKEAVGRADMHNMNVLPNYVKFFYNYAPSGCWGSKGSVSSWINRHHTGGNEDD